MKIYAKQTPPEYQQSPLNFYDDFPENVQIFGNDRYNEHVTDQFHNIPELLENLADELEYLQAGKNRFRDLQTVLEAYTGRDNYTRQERKKWLDVVRRWTDTDEEITVFCDVLELLTGKPHKIATLRGCCQGDWQRCIYPADEYSEKNIEALEAEYFNTGTEWTIYENGLDGDECYTAYCTTYKPREFIAELTGAKPDDIILLEFDGWERTPKYKEVRV